MNVTSYYLLTQQNTNGDKPDDIFPDVSKSTIDFTV